MYLFLYSFLNLLSTTSSALQQRVSFVKQYLVINIGTVVSSRPKMHLGYSFVSSQTFLCMNVGKNHYNLTFKVIRR